MLEIPAVRNVLAAIYAGVAVWCGLSYIHNDAASKVYLICASMSATACLGNALQSVILAIKEKD